MSKYTDEQIEEFADNLVGSCGIFDKEDAEMFDSMTVSQNIIFDEIVFDCEQCGWWSVAEEKNQTENGQICEECWEDNNNEEE